MSCVICNDINDLADIGSVDTLADTRSSRWRSAGPNEPMVLDLCSHRKGTKSLKTLADLWFNSIHWIVPTRSRVALGAVLACSSHRRINWIGTVLACHKPASTGLPAPTCQHRPAYSPARRVQGLSGAARPTEALRLPLPVKQQKDEPFARVLWLRRWIEQSVRLDIDRL